MTPRVQEQGDSVAGRKVSKAIVVSWYVDAYSMASDTHRVTEKRPSIGACGILWGHMHGDSDMCNSSGIVRMAED